MSAHNRASTGIDGLDLILDGGLRFPAEGSIFLVILGGPGTGKTHLALELCIRMLARHGGEGALNLYYGLDQTPSEIHAKLSDDFDYYDTGDWDQVTGSIRAGEYEALLHSVRMNGNQHLLHTASLRDKTGKVTQGSESLFQRLDRDIDAVTKSSTLGKPLSPGLVAIDNITLTSLDDGEDVRTTLRSVRDRLAQRRLHGIFAVETPGGEVRDRAAYAAAEYAADVIIQLGYHAFGDQFKERSIEISKARHQFYFRGTHHFSIVGRSGDQLRGARGQRPPGIHVYPSVPTLLSYLQYRSTGVPHTKQPTPFGVADLTVGSESANGLIGPPERLDVLYWLTLRFLLQGSHSSLLISFQNDEQEILELAQRWFPNESAESRIKVMSFQPEYLSSGKFLKDVYDGLESLRSEGKDIGRVAVCGLEHLRWGFPLLHDVKMLIPWLRIFFRSQNITSLLTETMSATSRDTTAFADSATAATTDNVFELVNEAKPRIKLCSTLNARLPGGAVELEIPVDVASLR